ncbi:MAG: hypothetical protein WA919_23825 [Coleofasciculaceae cyanobacterium]
MLSNDNRVIIFDTTMRDGELALGVKMNLQQKTSLAKLLEAIGVDVIEVGYPGVYAKDFEEISQISQIIDNSTICGLASSKLTEIEKVAEAIKPAKQGRIHTYIPVNLKSYSTLETEKTLAAIKDSVSLSRSYCDDVEWSAFDAPRSDPDFLCKAIETAINSGATTISIPDSLGLATPEEFSQLLSMVVNRVPNIDQVILSVHCHDDLGKAVDNSLAALGCGVRQIECSINGLGARKGNADLGKIVRAVLSQGKYQIEIDTSLISQASELVNQITRLSII